MSKQTNYGGKSFVVDRVVELFNSTRSSATINSIKQQISAQQSLKDLDKIREEIENATSDGVISSHEKKGLKREWSSLLSSWLTIRESFENDDNLKSNATFLILKSTIEMLTSIMDKVFENMDTDYIGDDVAKITDLFVSAWDGITRCSQLIQDRLSLSERHRLEVEGDRTIVDSIALKARLYIYANGGYVDVTSSTDYADTDFTWTKPADSEWEAHTGRELSITLADMKSTSPSQFMLTFSHGYKQADSEETIEVNLSVLVSISYGKKIQYAWSDADSVSDLKKDPMLVWNPEPLDNSRNLLYLWRRESSDLSKEDADKVWIYFRETGEKGDKGDPGEAGEAGKDAPLPIVEYQYSNSDRTAPILYKPFKLGGKIMKFKSLLLGDNNSKDWVQNPVKLGKYKWMRISTDGGKTWTYSAVTGPEPSFFELMSSKDTFRQNARGAVDEADEISFWVVRHNISSVDKPAWEVSPSSLSPDASLLHNEQIKVKVPIGFAYGSFSVSVSIGENSETLSKIIYGEKNGEVVARKLGLIDRTVDPPQEFPTTLADGISPLADGDYLLVRLADSNQKTYLVPYRYSTRTDPSTGQREGWVPSSSAYSDHSEIMANVLTDVLANSETTPSVSAFYGFFRSLVSNDAFIKFLCTQYLQIQGSIYGGGFDKDGNNPNNETGFYIDSKTGALRAISAVFNDATIQNTFVNGYFETKDDEGIILKTSKQEKSGTFSYQTSGYIVSDGFGEIQGSYKNIKLEGYSGFFYKSPSFDVFNDDSIQNIDENDLGKFVTLTKKFISKSTNDTSLYTESISIPVDLNLIGCSVSIYATSQKGKTYCSLLVNETNVYNKTLSYTTEKISVNVKKGDTLKFVWHQYDSSSILGGFQLFVLTNDKASKYSINSQSDSYISTYYDYRFYSEAYRQSIIDFDDFSNLKFYTVEKKSANQTNSTKKYEGPAVFFYDSNGLLLNAYDAKAMKDNYFSLYSTFNGKGVINVEEGSFLSKNESGTLKYIECKNDKIEATYIDNNGSFFKAYKGKYLMYSLDKENEIVQKIIPILTERGLTTSSIYPTTAKAFDIGSADKSYSKIFAEKYFIKGIEIPIPIIASGNMILFSNKFCIYKGIVYGITTDDIIHTETVYGCKFSSVNDITLSPYLNLHSGINLNGYNNLPSVCLTGIDNSDKTYTKFSFAVDTRGNISEQQGDNMRVAYTVFGTLSDESFENRLNFIQR